MANNCLLYNVSEEKGVVLNGPPGSGKTFLVRTWLSENKKIHDISTSPSALHNPANPIDGTVENLVKVYDIAKMIAPVVVFFDEGDALAPRRSSSGGAPSDKLTNKFLIHHRRRTAALQDPYRADHQPARSASTPHSYAQSVSKCWKFPVNWANVISARSSRLSLTMFRWLMV